MYIGFFLSCNNYSLVFFVWKSDIAPNPACKSGDKILQILC